MSIILEGVSDGLMRDFHHMCHSLVGYSSFTSCCAIFEVILLVYLKEIAQP